MKRIVLQLSFLFLILTSFTSCELIGDIFQAGFAVGIFVVVLVIILIIWILRKFRK